jgi:hypothetical protein
MPDYAIVALCSQIALLANADRRTVLRYIRGESIRPSSARAIRAALKALGVPDPNPEPPPNAVIEAISAAPTPAAASSVPNPGA